MFGEQLELPLSGVTPASELTRIPRARRVFANRSLKMANVDWVGFDMDYTLAIYRQQEMDRLSVEATVEKLCARGYPEEILGVEYPIDFPIRGLLIDKKYGHILKLDRFKHVQKGYHGLRRLEREELRALYQSKRIRNTSARYHFIDTLYALSECAVYAKVVEVLEEQNRAVDYHKLFDDIRESIDEAHRDGRILNVVQADLPRFVERDPLLAQTLHKLRSAGKRLFLLTNSRWPFTEKMMTYLLGDSMPEYPSFRHYFDLVVVAAQKPGFFQLDRPLHRRVDDRLDPITLPLERGAIYEGGNAQELERAMGSNGDRILYIGDHIYGDILRSRRESAWRTAMIIQEMEAEVLANEACQPEHALMNELAHRREELEDQLRFYQQRFKDASRKLEVAQPASSNGAPVEPAPLSASDRAQIDADRGRAKRSVERIRGHMRAIDAEAAVIERRIDEHFHPFWGSLLKESNDRASFGDQVEEYACLYTSRVSNFGSYSPLQHFRSARDRMAHEQ